MNLLTIYKTMEESAKLCPNGENIKFLFRHSIREKINKNASNDEMQNARLIREGRKMAECLGESLDLDIGTVSSSPTQRCIDTCQEIINGFNQNHIEYSQIIHKSRTLQCPYIKKENDPEEQETWEKLGSEGIFDCFAKNIEMPGFFDLETSAKLMLKYMFNTGNKHNTLDLFCTHDLQLAMLLLFFAENKSECKNNLFSDNDSWPLMLEGMFLWGNENNYNVLWRGKLIKNSPSAH